MSKYELRVGLLGEAGILLLYVYEGFWDHNTMRGNKILHYFDRYILKVFLWLLRFSPQKNKDVKALGNKIAISKLTGIGDLALATTVLVDIERSFPKAKLILYLGRENSSLIELLPITRYEIIILDIKTPIKNFSLIRKQESDVFIDLGQWTHYEALLAYFSGAQKRIGFQSAKQCRHLAFTHVAEHRSDVHELNNFQTIARLAGGGGTVPARLRIIDQAGDVKRGPKKRLVFHPWPSGVKSELKEWPYENWVKLAEALGHEGYEIYISAGPHDRKRQNDLLACFERKSIKVHDLCNVYSLSQLADFLKEKTILVSVNTGIMHMAAILNVPVIALHGPTDPKRWGPVGDNVVNLTAYKNAFNGCLNHGFEYPRNMPQILSEITPETVCKAVKQINDADPTGIE